MKRHSSDDIRAMYKSNEPFLCSHSYLPTYSHDIEGVKKEIDAANRKAIQGGWKPSMFVITCVEWYTYYDDNGNFIKREENEYAIETYPAQ